MHLIYKCTNYTAFLYITFDSCLRYNLGILGLWLLLEVFLALCEAPFKLKNRSKALTNSKIIKIPKKLIIDEVLVFQDKSTYFAIIYVKKTNKVVKDLFFVVYRIILLIF